MLKHRSNNLYTKNCYPLCDISLPRIGKMSVSSRLNVCRTPATLTLSIMCDGRRSISTFVAGNQREVRPIGNDYWPLQLQVHFYKIVARDAHYAKVCVETVRTGNLTCFMNGVLENSLTIDKSQLPSGSSISDCGFHYQSISNFPTVLLCVVLATCFLMIGISIATMLYRKNTNFSRKKFGKNDQFDKKIKILVSPAITEPASYYKFSKIDDRLPVIAEGLENELSASMIFPILDSNLSNNSIVSQHSNIALSEKAIVDKLGQLKSDSSGYLSRSSNHDLNTNVQTCNSLLKLEKSDYSTSSVEDLHRISIDYEVRQCKGSHQFCNILTNSIEI